MTKKSSFRVETKKRFFSKKTVIFDLDGTLTKNKTKIDQEMAKLLCQLLTLKKVAVIGGGSFSQWERQFLKSLKCPKGLFENLILLPTNGAQMRRRKNNNWKIVYSRRLTKPQKEKVFFAIKAALKEAGWTKPKKTHGKIIEDRKNQITFSALGQKAPLKSKLSWNKRHSALRQIIKSAVEKRLPKFEVKLGGLTSIDIIQNGVDKAYGAKQAIKAFGVKSKDALYLGDALYKDGNDYVVKKTGLAVLAVKNEAETKKFIRALIKAADQSK